MTLHQLTSSLAFALGLASVAACSTAAAQRGASLSLSSPDSLTPAVGDQVHIVVRAVFDDGSSEDVTDTATCVLSGGMPPGTLVGAVFTATGPGTTDVECTWEMIHGSMGITIDGRRTVKAADIQRGQIQIGTVVDLDLVVYAIEPDHGYTDLYAQDAGGGKYSGIYLRDRRTLTATEMGVPPAKPGDVVHVSGTYRERHGRSIVEFDAVVVKGTATPTAEALRIADVDPAIWDGCFIRLSNVVVTNPMVDAYTWQIAQANAPTPTLLVETLLFDAAPSAGQKYAVIAGPLYIDQPQAAAPTEVAIAPRSADDLMTGQVSTVSEVLGLPDGTAVVIAGASVSAVDPFTSGMKMFYDLFAQDPAGGPRAGIHGRDLRTAPTAIAEGDIVTLTGKLGTHNGSRVIDMTNVSVTGHGAVTTTPIALAGLDPRMYENSLVKLSNLKVSIATFDPHAFQVIDRAGGAGNALVDDYFYKVAPATNATFASIVGVVYCDATRCAVAPRRAGDVTP